jgi:hypothetical protein
MSLVFLFLCLSNGFRKSLVGACYLVDPRRAPQVGSDCAAAQYREINVGGDPSSLAPILPQGFAPVLSSACSLAGL